MARLMQSEQGGIDQYSEQFITVANMFMKSTKELTEQYETGGKNMAKP